jgi:hypothetical protein
VRLVRHTGHSACLLLANNIFFYEDGGNMLLRNASERLTTSFHIAEDNIFGDII